MSSISNSVEISRAESQNGSGKSDHEVVGIISKGAGVGQGGTWSNYFPLLHPREGSYSLKELDENRQY